MSLATSYKVIQITIKKIISLIEAIALYAIIETKVVCEVLLLIFLKSLRQLIWNLHIYKALLLLLQFLNLSLLSF